MFGSSHGRFTSTDPFGPWAMSEDEKADFLSSPQQWNRYIYVVNNPLKFNDPTGLYVCDTSLNKTQCQQIDAGLKEVQQNGTKEQRKIAKFLLDKNNKTVFALGSKTETSVNDSKGANALIQRGNATANEASKFVTITLSAGDFTGSQEGFQGQLVHEGRHSFVAVDVITSFSNNDSVSADITRFENEFQAHYSADLYFRKRGGTFEQFATKQLGELKVENGEIKINEQQIRNKLATVYKDDVTGGPLTEKNPGFKTSQVYGLKPRTP